MSVWSDVIAGFALIAGTYWLIKTVRSWRRFRRSVQKEIYSGYFEYAFRSKNLMRLSESFYFKNTFGKHRIFYQLAQAENQKAPQAYVLILLTSGLYILNIKNQGGKITAGKTGDFKQHYAEKNGNKKSQAEHLYLLENPIEESRFFEERIRKRLKNFRIPYRSIVVFPDRCELSWDKEAEKEIPVIRRGQLLGLLEADFTKALDRLTENQIDEIFHILADESIALEKNS